jgi:cell division protein FtsB
MKTKFALVTLAILLSVRPAFAQFGSGIVFDPTNYKNAVLRYIQLQQQLAQLRQTYTTLTQQYQFLQYQARQIQNMARYRSVYGPWLNLTAPNTYGNTADWVLGMNTGNQQIISNAYRQIAPAVSTANGVDLGTSQVQIQNATALEELTEGTTINGMATVGQLRTNSAQLEQQIKNLENDSLSSAPDLNTQTAVLNKINAANMILIRQMQDTNKLLVALLEQQMLAGQRQREAHVGFINDEIQRRKDFDQAMSFTTNVSRPEQTPIRLP